MLSEPGISRAELCKNEIEEMDFIDPERILSVDCLRKDQRE